MAHKLDCTEKLGIYLLLKLIIKKPGRMTPKRKKYIDRGVEEVECVSVRFDQVGVI